jgi:hypothetical protein
MVADDTAQFGRFSRSSRFVPLFAEISQRTSPACCARVSARTARIEYTKDRLASRSERRTTASGRALRSEDMESVVAPEIVAARPRPSYVVRVMFADGEVRDVDITPLLDTEAFAPLRDPELFTQVAVDEKVGTIAWPDGVDLDPSAIYSALDLGANKAQIKVLAPSVVA